MARDVDDLVFPISLSVGTGCQAKCPHCSIPHLPQHLAGAHQLIGATDRLIQDVECCFRQFSVRVTGGEIGLIADFGVFIAWLNEQERVRKVRLYTNGLLFELHSVDLARKCYVHDHTIHDVVFGRLIRYAPDQAPTSLVETRELIARRRLRCRGYRMVMLARPGVDVKDRAQLEHAGVQFLELTGAAGGIFHPSSRTATTFCFNSRYQYVYDVAHNLYFHCCEVKTPVKGKFAHSLRDFLCSPCDSPYSECIGCRTCWNIRTHRNAAAIERLRFDYAEKGIE